MTALLKFEDVTIQYPIFNSRNMSLRNQLVRISTGGRIENEAGRIQLVTALRNANFTINHGDTVALIGHNGAGKSTLLRTMAGVYTPALGKVIREGRVATVLELGTGMDPELSGYENITRMSMLLGMSKKQIEENAKEIAAFTQLGDFLALPVRTYSSGMATRLMFAVATSTKPDILLVDEMFGTGDAEFQAHAKKRMEDLIKAVGIFVFASHSNDLVKTYCKRFFFLEHGIVKEIDKGDVDNLTDRGGIR
jgi:ABC-type polysaccharide/polyol phosphate transport system ATPase subunit